ncbi:hypothetical protein HZA56_02705 [Candidatus Poribacteria bacterium]|nr:hypothetical protein [Candidatus Poribacteria bacterium]
MDKEEKEEEEAGLTTDFTDCTDLGKERKEEESSAVLSQSMKICEICG